MKLMDIDADTLGIPDTDYDARVTMPSSEFSRIVRDLSQLGESVRIEVSKEGVRFVSEGEAANGNILLKQSEITTKAGSSSTKKEEDADEEQENEEDGEDEGDDGKKKAKKAKKEKVKKETGEDVSMNGEEHDEEEFKADDEDGEEEQEEDSSSKKRKKAPAKVGCLLCTRSWALILYKLLTNLIGDWQGYQEGEEEQGW